MILLNKKRIRSSRGHAKFEGGYILLLSLLVISILIAVGFGMATMSIQEAIFSSFLRDSERALAAASSGAECALYWDRSISQNGMRYTIFATSTNYADLGNLIRAVCNNGQSDVQLLLSQRNGVSTWKVTKEAATGTTVFTLDFADGTCADISVIKVGNESTKVVSDGFNTCEVEVPRRTEREIAVFTNI